MLADRYSLFIFDWDGTLSTSTSVVKAARHLKMRYNVSHIKSNKESYKIEKLPNVKEGVEMSKPYAIAYWFYSLFYKPRLKPGSIELLRYLKRKGKKVAVFSDSNRFRLMIEARKLGVIDYIDFILSADSIQKFKPNPTGLALIIRRFGFGKDRCIYVGDMAADMFTAKFAGIASCAVADGVDDYDVLNEAGADYIVRSIGLIKGIR